jgi:plastocyanin
VGAVLTVHALNGSSRPAAPVNAVMDQVDRAFVPDVLVIPAGSTVEFPNSDSVSHQIYSFSAAKKFQLPLYRGKRYPPVLFDQVGFVTLGCNIHDSMLAYVLVTDAPYFGRTDSAGSWSVDVPRGTYRITVWHPRMRENGELEREMTIGDGDRAALTVRLVKPLQPAPLEGRHSWDAY